MSKLRISFTLKICLLVVLTAACSRESVSKPTVTPYEEFANVPGIILPADLDGLITVLLSQNIEARIQAARVVGSMGPAAEAAVPVLTQNLYHPNFELRRAAAEALVKIGPVAKPSVSILTVVLLDDVYVHARRAAAEALGKFGEMEAVPALAAGLGDEDIGVQIEAAISLAALTGQEFPDLHANGYSLNQEGVPLIVIAAREWWEKEGRYQNWTGE